MNFAVFSKADRLRNEQCIFNCKAMGSECCWGVVVATIVLWAVSERAVSSQPNV